MENFLMGKSPRSNKKVAEADLIVSASRRTDIPALYPDWLLARLRAGEALVPSRFNPGKLFRIDLRPESVDCLVLWTKNPAPLIDKLGAIDDLGHRYYFQFTLNPYGPPLEPGLPPLEERLGIMERLAGRLGPKAVVWRYDPIILNRELTPAWHLEKFGKLAERLSGLVEKTVISFVDAYRHQPVAPPSDPERLAAAEGLAEAALKSGLALRACAERVDLGELGIEPSSCVDADIVESVIGRRPLGSRDRGQRPLCRCHESRDIGVYQSCVNGCLYCYATTSRAKAAINHAAHDPFSPTLIGRPDPGAAIVEANPPKAKGGKPARA